MKNLINFEVLTIENVNGFLTIEKAMNNAKQFKKLLRRYRILHDMGLNLNSENRELMLQNLISLQVKQMEFARAFMLPESEARTEKIEALKILIEALQLNFKEIEKIESEEVFEPVEVKPNLITLVGFTFKTKKDEEGKVIDEYYENPKGKVLRVKDTTKQDALKAKIAKFDEAIEAIKKEKRKALRAAKKELSGEVDKVQKKSDNFAEKVNEKKRKS